MRILILTFTSLILGGCNSDSKMMIVSILQDQTDTLNAPISIADISGILQFDQQPQNGAEVRISAINDVGFNKTATIALAEVKNKYVSNEYQRKTKDIPFFMDSVATAIESWNAGISKMSSSYVIQAIQKECIYLSNSNADTKILVISSDLAENSNFLNMYDDRILQRIKNGDTELFNLVNERYPLPDDLSDIQVFIHYIPKDRIKSDEFEIISSFYRQYLTSHNAKFTIN